MTVEELIRVLLTHDHNREVRIAQPTHNYWREIEAVPVGEVSLKLVDASDMINGDPDEEAYLYLVLGA